MVNFCHTHHHFINIFLSNYGSHGHICIIFVKCILYFIPPKVIFLVHAMNWTFYENNGCFLLFYLSTTVSNFI